MARFTPRAVSPTSPKKALPMSAPSSRSSPVRTFPTTTSTSSLWTPTGLTVILRRSPSPRPSFQPSKTSPFVKTSDDRFTFRSRRSVAHWWCDGQDRGCRSFRCETIVVPRANTQDVLLDDRFENMVEVVAVDTLDEVMQYALIKHEQKAGLVERLEAVIDRLTPEVQSKISLV